MSKFLKIIFIIGLVLFGAYYFFMKIGNSIISDHPEIKKEDLSFTDADALDFCQELKLSNEQIIANGYGDSRYQYVSSENDSHVKALKENILSESNMSREYFDNHFKFLCAKKVGYLSDSSRMISSFSYSVDEYSTRIEMISDEYNGQYYFDFNYLKGFKEVENVLSAEIVLEKLKTCLGRGKITRSELIIGSKGVFFGVYNHKNNDSSTLYLSSINLETGECVDYPVLAI